MDMTSEAKMASRAGSSVSRFITPSRHPLETPGTKGQRGAMPKAMIKEDDAKTPL